VLIRRSKTEQVGDGDVSYLSRTSVRHLKTWLTAVEIRRTASASGFKESPISPNMCLTPTCSSALTKTSAIVWDKVFS